MMSSTSNTAHDGVQALRAAIEQVDDQIVAALARRMALARAMAEAKQEVGQSILDPAREVAVVTRAARAARQLGLPDREVRGLYWSILAMSRRAQVEVNRGLAMTGSASFGEVLQQNDDADRNPSN